tara:strand:+ start:274 stop:873 length:600 start_codon:yes stop_codon:yes gene_type:complete
MKIFLAVLVLIFSLQSWTKAEELGEFKIEGILLKESLLNYFDKKKIEEKKKRGFIYPKNDFYSATFSSPKFIKYDRVQFHLKAEDKKYLIYSLTGQIEYKNNIKKCYHDMDNIVSEIKSIFNEPKIVDLGIGSHSIDQETKVKTVFIDLISTNYQEAAIVIECYDWSEKQTKQNGRTDRLSISVDSREFEYWINNVAYK